MLVYEYNFGDQLLHTPVRISFMRVSCLASFMVGSSSKSVHPKPTRVPVLRGSFCAFVLFRI